MPSESVHHRRKSREYNIVVIPGENAGKTTTFRVRPLILAVIACVLLIFIGAITFVLLNYTPLALVLPVTNPALEEKYGKKIAILQEKLDQVSGSVLMLEGYNSKLRKVLGDPTAPDSGAMQKNQATGQHGGVTVEDERLPVVPPQQSGLMPASPGPQRGPYYEIRRNDANLLWNSPVEGFVTRRYDPANGHFGIDIAGKVGTGIFAAADGHVIFSGWTVDDGNMIIVAHPNGFVTFYKHNQALLTGSNATVKRGEPIALLGNSGKTSLGPHLHFEIWFNGTPRDPGEFIGNAHL